MSIAELTDKALALPPNEKAELVKILVNSMKDALGDILKEDVEIALKRKKEMDEGLVKPLCQEEFFEPFKSRYGSWF